MTLAARTPPETIEFDPFAGPAIVASAPTTAAQREIWAATRLGVDASLAFNESVTIRLAGALDEGALRTAVWAVVARHEALRTIFAPDGEAMMVLEPPAEVPLVVHDWSALDAAACADALAALCARVVDEPFELTSGPLVRFALGRLGPEAHALVITAHHIVCDGWSFGVVARDLAGAYTAARAGRPLPIDGAPRLSVHARRSHGEDARAALAEAERYWTACLADAPAPVELPTDRPRPPERTFAAGRVDHVLQRPLVQRLARVGAADGASLFATLLAGFGAFLARATGEDDLVVGIPAAGQATAGEPDLVGHLVHLLPVRLRPDLGSTVPALLRSVRGAVLDAFEHHALTFGALLARLPLPRDASRPPLVSVAFNLERGVGAAAMPFDGLQAAFASNPRRYELFELFVNAVDVDGVVTLECQYNAALFDPESVAGWMASYERLLEAMATAGDADGGEPAATVGRLPIVPAAHLEAIARWNATERALPATLLAHHPFERQAARTPHAVALLGEGETLTYAELDAQANRIAGWLRAAGVRRGSFVGHCLRRRPTMVAALLGILKAGGTYVPLDPDHPVERLAFTMRDAQLAALITDAALPDGVPADAMPTHVLRLDADAAALAARSAAPLPPDDPGAATAETPAYVIYTSGSTGTPKGCLCTHAGLANFLVHGELVPALGPDDVGVALATVAFDASLIDLLLPLAVGARVVVTTREVAADGMRLRRLLERAGVTFMFATPTTYRLLLAAGWTGGAHLKVTCGGEAMPRELAEALLARAGALWNIYGPSETTIWVGAPRLRRPVVRVTIGGPTANARFHVVDAHGAPVPIGVPGELVIGGSCVAAGYLARPALTAERFLPDPARPGGRLYRSGDVVRWLRDGQLEYLGRNDHQVKLRGFRIELGEIESRLAAHPAVRGAAVVVREDRPGDRRLVAYVVPADGEAPTDAALRAALREALPEYMVPQAFVRLATLPTTPSGKVDRRALPAPDAADAVRGSEFVAPRTPLEHEVAALWASVLNVGALGVHDDFFQLGGHSLLASQVLARLRREHGVEIPYRRIFEASTVEAFARVVAAARAGEGGAPSDVADAPIPHVAGRTTAPLSILQERVWLLEELDPAMRAANNAAAMWRLQGPVRAELVQGAMDAICARHDQLRTRFAVVDGARVQVIEPGARVVLGRATLADVPVAEREAALVRFAEAHSEVPFDPGVAPLFRGWLVEFAPDDVALVTVRHRLIWDGWSFDLFLHEFGEHYAALAEGREPAVPALPVSYGDFAEWQRAWVGTPAAARQVAWWRERLDGDLPVLALPTDRPRPAQPTYQGGRVVLRLADAELARVQALALARGATVFQLCLAAYVALLHRHSGQRDLLVGTPVRARTRPELEPLIGPFVNTVPLRLQVDPSLSFAALLAQVRDRTLDAFGHQEMPFELLGDRQPVLRALFSLQDVRTRPLQVGPLALSQVHAAQHTATNDLMLWTMQHDDHLLAVLNYSADLFDRATADAFLGQWRTLLLDALDDAERPVGALRLMSALERARLVGAPPEAPAPRQPPVAAHRRVAARGAADPAAIAVVERGEEVSCAELLERVRAVASAVAPMVAAARDAGSGPGAAPATTVEGSTRRGGREVVVGVRTETVAARAAAVLGAHAAGAAALLLDPADAGPFEQALLAAAGVDLLLTDADVVAAAPADDAVIDGDPAPTDVALLLPSLGSDGAPRLATLTHGTLAALLEDVSAALALGADDVVAALLPPSADVAPVELLLPLHAGARLLAAPADAFDDEELLAEFLADAPVTAAIAPPERWEAVVRAGWTGAPRLTAVVAGETGDALLAALAPRVGRVATAWGHLDAGLWSALHERAHEGEAPRLGRALAGSRLHVLDDAGEPVAAGMIGTLVVGVDSVAAVASAAVERDPFAPGGGWRVRTGDRARRRADGALDLVAVDPGRTRLRGGTVELAGIAAVLRTHPAMEDAAVLPRVDAYGQSRLVAYLVSAGGAALPSDTELRALVRRTLPDRAVPQLIVPVARIERDDRGLPLTAELPLPAALAPVRAHVEPRTAEERLLAAIWCEMLGVSRVSVGDNFFALGGHSLLAFQVVARVARDTGRRLSPRPLLLGTLEQAAEQLRSAPLVSAAASPPVAPGTDAAGPTGPVGAWEAPPEAPSRTAGGLLARLRGVLGDRG